MSVLAESPRVKPCDHATIIERVKTCPRLPSLRSIETALKDLLNADNRFTTQISEVIRRDPSLTARLLRLVNSVYYGLTTPVNSIEEAVFYLGIRQIRQLAVVTPVIEDFQKLAGATAFQWREFWQHCIATAFPRHFNAIYLDDDSEEGEDILERESRILGVDHTELGAIYLSQHQLPGVLAEVARHHHNPERCERSRELTAAVHIADLLVRYAHIGTSGNNE